MNPPDLSSLVFALRPLQSATDVPHLGRAAHAVLLDAVRWADPALAEAIHAGSDVRPFTASDLIGYSHRKGLTPEHACTLRLTTLTQPVTQALLKATSSEAEDHAAGRPPLSVGAQVQLGAIVFRVEAVVGDAGLHPWVGATTYAVLSAPWLLWRENPDAHGTLQFASPTTFKSGGRHVPVPLPAWVFGGLLERWNAFAPVAFPPELRRYAEECLALSKYQLKSRMVTLMVGATMQDGGMRIGAVGRARYVATNRDRYWLSLINLLAEYAFFAGVGAGNGMGLGQCRRLRDEG